MALGNVSINSHEFAKRCLGALGRGFSPGSEVTAGTPGSLYRTQRGPLGILTCMLHGPADLVALLSIAHVVADTGADGENEHQPQQSREKSTTSRLTHGVPNRAKDLEK